MWLSPHQFRRAGSVSDVEAARSNKEWERLAVEFIGTPGDKAIIAVQGDKSFGGVVLDRRVSHLPARRDEIGDTVRSSRRRWKNLELIKMACCELVLWSSSTSRAWRRTAARATVRTLNQIVAAPPVWLHGFGESPRWRRETASHRSASRQWRGGSSDVRPSHVLD